MSTRAQTHPSRLSLQPPEPSSSNLSGILMSIESGLVRLAKQTPSGDEYAVTATDASTAWQRLSRITGSTVSELKRLRLTRVQ